MHSFECQFLVARSALGLAAFDATHRRPRRYNSSIRIAIRPIITRARFSCHHRFLPCPSAFLLSLSLSLLSSSLPILLHHSAIFYLRGVMNQCLSIDTVILLGAIRDISCFFEAIPFRIETKIKIATSLVVRGGSLDILLTIEARDEIRFLSECTPSRSADDFVAELREECF